jgi:NADH-quinone oxidoreductase subunit J
MMAGVYALLGATFLAVIQIMVYAGAIMVLFVFVIMLLNLGDDELGRPKFTLTKALAAVTAIFLVGAMALAFTTLGQPDARDTVFPGLNRLADVPGRVEVNIANNNETTYDDNGEPVAVTVVERARAQQRVALWSSFGSIEAVGLLLYTKWLLVFEVTGLLLLGAVVGAIMIARKRV